MAILFYTIDMIIFRVNIFQGPDTCSHFDVLHTKHTKHGDTGKYFYFDQNKFDAMIGSSDWSRKIFNIIQKGSIDWSGPVKVWRNPAHGRRWPGESNNQWVTGDTLEICKSGKFQLSLNSIQEPIILINTHLLCSI